MILKYIVLKGHKNIFRFSFFPRKITEWNKLVKKTSYQSISLYFSKVPYVILQQQFAILSFYL